MRKLTVAILLTAIAAVFGGCTQKQQSNEPVIGVAKVISHTALDAVEKGITDVLSEKGVKVKYDFQNANGDINTAASIANKFKADKVDIAVGIGTPVAVAIASVITDKPVIFSAITDPVSANLVETLDHGYKNITGTIDTIPIKEQIDEFLKIYPFKKLGFIYTSSESNSVSMAATTEAICKDLGIEFIAATITNSSEVKQAAESLIGRVDAFYAVNDNALMTGINALTSTAAANKIPVFGADAISALDGGSLYVMGFDYYNLGRATGEMIIEVLNGKKPSEIPVYALKDPQDYIFENGSLKEQNNQ